jgi:hypothetical protein
MKALIVRQYILSILLPVAGILVQDFVVMPPDCHECPLLTLVSAVIWFLMLAIFNLPHFLLLRAWGQKGHLRLFLLLILPAVLLLVAVVFIYGRPHNGYYNTDLYMNLTPALINVCLCARTIALVKTRIQQTI